MRPAFVLLLLTARTLAPPAGQLAAEPFVAENTAAKLVLDERGCVATFCGRDGTHLLASQSWMITALSASDSPPAVTAPRVFTVAEELASSTWSSVCIGGTSPSARTASRRTAFRRENSAPSMI